MEMDNIINSLNLISEKLFKSVESEVYKVLDDIIVINQEILKKEPLKNIFFENEVNGIIIIANSLLLFSFIYYIANILLSLYNGNQAQNIDSFIFKMLIITLIVNNSYYICSQILEITGIFSECIDEFASSIISKDLTFTNLKEAIISIKDFNNNDILSLNGILKGVISFGSVSILINFAIRYVIIVFLIIISPIAFACLSNYISSGITKTWGKLVFTNLITQVVVKLVLLIPLSFKHIDTVLYKIILVGSIYILYRINNFVRDITVQVSSGNISQNIFKGG